MNFVIRFSNVKRWLRVLRVKVLFLEMNDIIFQFTIFLIVIVKLYTEYIQFLSHLTFSQYLDAKKQRNLFFT